MKIFKWLSEITAKDPVISRSILERGPTIDGQIITLIGPKGIWKPKSFKYPVSITTTLKSPYNDLLTDDFLRYSYRGQDPFHSDNEGLRKMMNQAIPLIYFHAVMKGRYLAAWPVFIQGDDKANLKFKVSIDETNSLNKVEEPKEEYGRRLYITQQVRQRLHQRTFRERVIRAYNNQCTLCRIKHLELLDAAHIIPDAEEKGEPIVKNGLTLCKIHHAAFDANIIGISPDYKVSIRRDILQEVDGPMLKHGIQSLNNQSIILPKRTNDWPDRERLETRYKEFLKAI